MTDETTGQDETVRNQADRLWDNLKRGLQDGAEIAMSKAEELTQVGRARLDVARQDAPLPPAGRVGLSGLPDARRWPGYLQ